MRFVSIAVCLALVAVATAAEAGRKQKQPVSVWRNADNTGGADGAVGSARNSSDRNQYMHCALSGNVGGIWGYCEASDANNVFGACGTSSPSLIQIIGTIGTDSTVQFVWDANGNCTNVLVFNNSMSEPKKQP